MFRKEHKVCKPCEAAKCRDYYAKNKYKVNKARVKRRQDKRKNPNQKKYCEDCGEVEVEGRKILCPDCKKERKKSR